MRCRAAGLAFAFLFFTASLGTVWAGAPTRQVYYIPITEDEAHLHYASLNLAAGSDTQIVNVISMSAALSNTVIYYDQWEDGFEADLANPTQSTTRVWGDGNTNNGIPPGFATDVINAGSAIYLLSTNPYPHNLPAIYYDGGDKLGATKLLSVTMVLWPVFSDVTGDGVDLAEGCSVYDTTRFGTNFITPVGVNVQPTGGTEMFQSARVAIMASQADTVVNVDTNGDGTVDATRNLAEGEGWSTGPVRAGARVSASKPVQVHLMTGDVDAQYANRWATLYPTAAVEQRLLHARGANGGR